MAGQSVERELTTAEPTSSVGRDGCFLAGTEDDEELRALLRRSPTPGAVRVAFTREPRYSAAEGLAGATDYTVVHRDRGRLDAIGRLSAHRLHRNAAPIRIGYLGELRVAP
ncbi:MAG TPA: hypothetical protein VL049_18155, partial [Candidatus Dormibacteraeota bacterium]|nr:hypothetical protein [Candidatus Dormibacteraeota bacterium]